MRTVVVSERRPLGFRLETEPTVGADGKTIDINVASDYTSAPPDVRQETVNVPNTGGQLEMPITDFRGEAARTSIRVVNGASRMLGVWKAHRTPDQEAKDVAQAVFLTSHIVQQHLVPPVLSPAPITLPKSRGELQTRIFDVPADFVPFANAQSDQTEDPKILTNPGITFPKGATARLEHPGKLVVTNTAENLDRIGLFVREIWDKLPTTVALTVQVAQAPAAVVRPLIIESAQQSDHAAALAKLNDAIGKGLARSVGALYLETKSGQTASTRSMIDRQSVSELSWSSPNQPAVGAKVRGAGTRLEIEPTVGPDGTFVDLNYALDHHPALFSTRSESFIDPASNHRFGFPLHDFNVAKVRTSITLMNGVTKIIGAWRPVGKEEFVKDDVLRVAFATCHVVRHEPKAPKSAVIEHARPKKPVESPDQLIKVTYRVAPDFMSVGDETVGAAGKRLSAEFILKAQGIPFPEGAFAIFNAETSRLTVNNTRANLDLIEAFVASIGSPPPLQTAMTVHLFQSDASTRRQLVSSAARRSDHREELNRMLAAAKTGEMKPLGAIHITTKSGQQAMSEDVKEVSYFTGTAVDEKGIPSIKREMMPVGLRFEVEPIFGADGYTLDLNYSLDYHTAPPVAHIEDLSHPDSGDESIEVPLTDFHRAEIKSSILLRAGAARILGLWKPTGRPEFEQQDVLQIAILEAEIVPVGDGE